MSAPYATSTGVVSSGKTVYDFRSDTATIPTAEMLQAMVTAEVGDDVRDEDPTVHALQKKVSELCGKESALFITSGTMGNQLAIRTHVTQNTSTWKVVLQQVICDARSHLYLHELGGVAFNSASQILPLTPSNPSKCNFLTAELIEKHIFTANDLHTPVTTIISLENTLNGSVYPLEEIKKIRELANKHNIKMHLDGARLWNASVYSGISLAEYCKYFDSVSLCCSKGLGAPIGSVLVGTSDFINTARQYRKLLGGGWRQAGYLAACCIYAIDNNWKRMKEDHENTHHLWKGLLQLGFEVPEPQTNMVFADSTSLNFTFEKIIEEMDKIQKDSNEKILIEGEGHSARIVLHLQTPLHSVDKLLALLKQSLENLKSSQTK